MEVSVQLHPPDLLLANSPRIHWLGACVGCRSALNAMERREIACLFLDLNPGLPVGRCSD
jgi:hypothetical protein